MLVVLLLAIMGYRFEAARTDPPFALFLFLIALVLFVLLLPGVAVLIRATRLWRQAGDRTPGASWMFVGILLVAAAFALWRVCGRLLWEWLDLPLF